MSFTRRCVRSAAALAVASIALTGCADSVREGSVATPSVEQSASAAPAATLESAETEAEVETAGAESVRITGDYQADLAAVGFEPTSEDFEAVTEYQEEKICDEPMDSGDVFNWYERDIEYLAQNDTAGPDMIRVVVEYHCPSRSEYIEEILAGVDY